MHFYSILKLLFHLSLFFLTKLARSLSSIDSTLVRWSTTSGMRNQTLNTSHVLCYDLIDDIRPSPLIIHVVRLAVYLRKTNLVLVENPRTRESLATCRILTRRTTRHKCEKVLYRLLNKLCLHSCNRFFLPRQSDLISAWIQVHTAIIEVH